MNHFEKDADELGNCVFLSVSTVVVEKYRNNAIKRWSSRVKGMLRAIYLTDSQTVLPRQTSSAL